MSADMQFRQDWLFFILTSTFGGWFSLELEGYYLGVWYFWLRIILGMLESLCAVFDLKSDRFLCCTFYLLGVSLCVSSMFCIWFSWLQLLLGLSMSGRVVFFLCNLVLLIFFNFSSSGFICILIYPRGERWKASILCSIGSHRWGVFFMLLGVIWY